MPKYKIGPNGKMQIVDDKVTSKNREVSGEKEDKNPFNSLVKETTKKAVEEIKKTNVIKEEETPDDIINNISEQDQEEQEEYAKPKVTLEMLNEMKLRQKQLEEEYIKEMESESQNQQIAELEMQRQQEQMQNQIIKVVIVLLENDKITAPVNSNNINDFCNQLNISITEGSTFTVDNIVINTKSIKYYEIG